MLIALLHGQKSIEECWQYIRMCRTWTLSMDFDNLADLGYILIGWAAIWRQYSAQAGAGEALHVILQRGIMAAVPLQPSRRDMDGATPAAHPLSARGHGWIRGGDRHLCLRGHPRILQPTAQRRPSPFYAAFMQVFRLGILADFDLFEFEGLDPTLKLNQNSSEWERQDPDPGEDYVTWCTFEL